MGMWECLQMVEVSQPMDGVLPLADCPSEAYMSTKTEICISWDFPNTPLRWYEYDYVFFTSSELISLWCVYNLNGQRKLDVTPPQSAKKQYHVKMLFYKKRRIVPKSPSMTLARTRKVEICCWFSPLLREIFLPVLRFFPLLRNHHFQIPIPAGMVDEGLLSESVTTKISVIHSFLLSFLKEFSWPRRY